MPSWTGDGASPADATTTAAPARTATTGARRGRNRAREPVVKIVAAEDVSVLIVPACRAECAAAI